MALPKFDDAISGRQGGLHLRQRPLERQQRLGAAISEADPDKSSRAVIARDLKGEAFDATIHEIDQIVPYSAGGDNSAKNFRVVRKIDNRRKGGRMPTLKELL